MGCDTDPGTVLSVRDASLEVSSHDFSTGRSARVPILSGISLDVASGETVGVIGVNGAGKSTLLQAIGGARQLSSGEILAVARPHMLAIGSGLRQALSGRQNIEIGLYALGFSASEVVALADEIGAFADLGPSLDYAVGHYSSGMRARLGFAIATTVRPEILLIDEALAVGDASFRNRCYDKLGEITAAASTVLIASHSMSEIRRICTRCLWLDGGVLKADGSVREVVAAYQAANE